MLAVQKLADLADEIIGRKKIDADQIKALRREIFSEARVMERMLEDGVVDRLEAETLFSINDAIRETPYDAGWRDLFVEAITSHVLKDEISPDVLDEDEARFLLSRIKDVDVSRVEMELLVNILAEVKSAPPFFREFTLAALKEHVLRDGLIDEHDARMIRSLIYGAGAGKRPDDSLRAWLAEVDSLSSGEKNHPSWEALKLEAT